MTVGADNRRGSFRDCARSGPQVKDALPGGQCGAGDDGIDDRSEPPVNLAQVDTRDPIPHPDLPIRGLPVLG